MSLFVQSYVESLRNLSVIISGDWNVPQDYMKDTINYVHRNNKKSQKQIHQMMEVLDLVDTYSELHPESKRYSGRGSHEKQSRLDYFLTSSDFQAFITVSINSTFDGQENDIIIKGVTTKSSRWQCTRIMDMYRPVTIVQHIFL